MVAPTVSLLIPFTDDESAGHRATSRRRNLCPAGSSLHFEPPSTSAYD
jgi:hypothetical protein